MVTCGDTGLPVLACRAVYASFSFSGEEDEEELLKTRRLAGAAAAAANGRPCVVQSKALSTKRHCCEHQSVQEETLAVSIFHVVPLDL